MFIGCIKKKNLIQVVKNFQLLRIIILNFLFMQLWMQWLSQLDLDFFYLNILHLVLEE